MALVGLGQSLPVRSHPDTMNARESCYTPAPMPTALGPAIHSCERCGGVVRRTEHTIRTSHRFLTRRYDTGQCDGCGAVWYSSSDTWQHYLDRFLDADRSLALYLVASAVVLVLVVKAPHMFDGFDRAVKVIGPYMLAALSFVWAFSFGKLAAETEPLSWGTVAGAGLAALLGWMMATAAADTGTAGLLSVGGYLLSGIMGAYVGNLRKEKRHAQAQNSIRRGTM